MPRSRPGPSTGTPAEAVANKRIWPSRGRCVPTIARSSVDLPQPLGPTSERNWPRIIFRLMSPRTRLLPNQWVTPYHSAAIVSFTATTSVIIIPRTTFALQEAKTVIHGKAEYGQHGQIGIDYTHVQQF